MIKRKPPIFIVASSGIVAVFLLISAWQTTFAPDFAPAETARRESLPRLSDENGRVPLRVDSAGAEGLPTADSVSRPLRLLFFGDLMLDRHVGERIAAKGLEHLLAGLTTANATTSSAVTTTPPTPPSRGESTLVLEAGVYDIVMANLEGAVTDGGRHLPPANAYDFAFAPDLIGRFKPYGFNFFNLANNHFTDQGETGVVETAKNLDNLGIAYSGCPDTKTGDCTARIMEIGGQRVALLGFSQVYGALDREDVLKKVASSSEIADLVIVNIHWGREYEHDFLSSQQDLGRAMVDAGADMIIGHHPHVVQGMEVYRNKPIFYSLGNFIFDQYFSPDTQEGLAVESVVDGEGMELVLHPLKSRSSVVSEMTGEERDGFLKRFAEWSSLNDQFSILNGQLMINFQ